MNATKNRLFKKVNGRQSHCTRFQKSSAYRMCDELQLQNSNQSKYHFPCIKLQAGNTSAFRNILRRMSGKNVCDQISTTIPFSQLQNTSKGAF